MKIESYEAGCKQLGHDPEAIRPDVSKVPEKHQKAVMATFEMMIISEASWEGKQPDWNDGSQRKWIPWFDMEVDGNNPSGFRFYVSNFTYTASVSTGCSRICFVSEEECEYHAKQHEAKYRDMMVIPK